MNGWVILLNSDGMTPLPDPLVLAGWACGERSHVRGSAGVVVEDHPVYSARRVEQQISDQSRPAGLMHRAEPGAVVGGEVLIEQEVVFLRRVGLHKPDAAVDGPPAVRPWNPDTDQPVG